MTGRLAVSFSGLGNLSAEAQAAVNQLRNRLNQLEQDLAPLRGDWTGEASAAYQQAKSKWDQAINDLNLVLQNTGTAVNDSSADYRRVEQGNAASFGG